MNEPTKPAAQPIGGWDIPDDGTLQSAARYALRALQEESMAYADPLHHVEEGIRRLTPTLAQAGHAIEGERQSTGDFVRATLRILGQEPNDETVSRVASKVRAAIFGDAVDAALFSAAPVKAPAPEHVFALLKIIARDTPEQIEFKFGKGWLREAAMAALAAQAPAPREPVAWMCTRRFKPDQQVFGEPFIATNSAYVKAHPNHDWTPLYISPAALDDRHRAVDAAGETP